MNESKKIQQNDPLNDPNREYIVGLIKAIGGVEKTISDLNNSPTVALMKTLQDKLEGGSDIASFMWSLLRGARGEKGEKGESIKGEKGEPGLQGIPGKNADDEAIYRRLLKMIPDPIPGKKGEKGDPGKDAVVDYAKIINDVLTKIPKDKELKKEILKLSSKDIADLPDLVKKYIYDFSQERGATIVAPGASHLRTLADVNVKDLAVGYVPVWNGTQFVFEAKGSGSGSSVWGDLTGDIADQADLQAELDGKSDVGHDHSASDITSGTKTSSFISDFSSAVASLITGKADTVHTHSASDITSGTKTSSFISDFSSAVASLITGKLDASAYDDATSAETTTGTSTAKYVSPDGLAGSDYGKRIVGILVVDPATDVATGDGKAFFRVPSALNGYNLVGVAMNVYTAGTTGTMDIQVRNVTDSQDMLSTKLTIDSTETDTSTASTPAVINTSFDDVATGDKIAIDVDAVQTTKAKGLYVELTFQLP